MERHADLPYTEEAEARLLPFSRVPHGQEVRTEPHRAATASDPPQPSLDNALLNLNVKDQYNESITSLGFAIEDILESERDAGLGNGGLGRLASCYMDSLSSA